MLKSLKNTSGYDEPLSSDQKQGLSSNMTSTSSILQSNVSSVSTASTSNIKKTNVQHMQGGASTSSSTNTKTSNASGSGNSTTSSLKKHLNILRGNSGKKSNTLNEPTNSTVNGSKSSGIVGLQPIVNTQTSHQHQNGTNQTGTFIAPSNSISSTSPVSSMTSSSSLSSKLAEYEIKINDLNHELSKYQQNR